MTVSTLNHRTVEKPSTKIGVFNVAVWIIGFAGAIGGMWLSGSPLPLVIVPLSLAIGWPVRNYGSPHAYLIHRYKKRKAWRDEHGTLRTPPMGSKPRTADNLLRIEDNPIIHAKYTVPTADGTEVRTLALLPDDNGRFLTVGIRLSGASHEWLQSNPADKMGWDTDWMQSVIVALAATKDPDLQLAMATMVNSSNKEPDYVWNQRRGKEAVMQAAENHQNGESGYDPVDARIGEFMHDSTDTIHGSGGEPRNWVAIRMPWPVRFGRRIDLVDPVAVRRSSLWRVVSKMAEAYRGSDIDCSIATASELNELWQHLIGLQDLQTVRMYQQQRLERDESPETVGLVTPDSIDDGGRYLRIGGTYVAAGYVSRLTKESVQAGFQENLVAVEPGLSFSLVTWIDAKLLTGSKFKAKEKERWYNFFAKSLPQDGGVTNIEGDKRLAEIVEARERLTEEGGNRSSEYYILATVNESTPIGLDAAWEDFTASLAGTYEFTRLETGDDIQDAILAHIGKR